MKFKTLNYCMVCNKPKESHNTTLGIFTLGYGFHHWVRPTVPLQRVRMRLEVQTALKEKETKNV